jgi:uncharacterized protein
MKSRVLSEPEEIRSIISRCQVCHVAMTDPNGKPYVLPFNFGFEEDVIYFHSAMHGKKIDILKTNPALCVSFSTDLVLRYQHEEVACSYSMKYRSVLAYGTAEFVEDPDEKVKMMNILMKNYSARDFKFNPPSIREVCCWKMKVEKFECRVYGY